MSSIVKPETNRRKTLNANGLRATGQRALILDIIRRGGSHLDADEVYRQARRKHPGLSLSTVYRTLHMFKEAGLVNEVHFGEDHHHYEPRAPEEHHHLTCLQCGKVVEFKYPLSRYVKRNVSEARGFEIVDTEINMRGYCPECLKTRTL